MSCSDPNDKQMKEARYRHTGQAMERSKNRLACKVSMPYDWANSYGHAYGSACLTPTRSTRTHLVVCIPKLHAFFQDKSAQ
eukprot:scaffold77782_cov15-Tisochrysis_lutea.AAC.1